MNSPQMNLPDRNAGINLSQLSNLSPNIANNPNIQNINQLNFNNINNSNLSHIQNVQGNNNLGVMNYLNNIQNPLMNLPNLNQMIPGGPNYPNVHGQMNSINNNINNGQFQNQFNPNIMPQMTQITPAQQILNKMESSSNMKKTHINNSNKSQTNKIILMNTLQGILQDINSGTSSSAKDPRKNRKK